MADIYDGLKRAPRQELVNLNAIFDVYNPGTEVRIFSKRIVNFFKWLFKVYYRPVNMACELENRKIAMSGLSKPDLIDALKNRMRKALISTGKVTGINTDDRIFVGVIDKLTHVYRDTRYQYMSPAEKADELKRKCYLRNASIIKRLPVIWLIISMLFLIGIIVGTFVYTWKVILPVGVGFELAIYLLFKRMLAFEKLSRTLALSGRYLGQIFSVTIDELSIRKKENGENFEKGLRALHSLETRIQDNWQKKDELESDKTAFSNSLQQVEGSLRKYSQNRFENGMDLNDLKNIEKELLLDRDRLNDEIEQAKITIQELSDEITKDRSLYGALWNRLISDIKEYWSERYSMFKLSDDFYAKLVKNFEWYSYDIIEKRIIELAGMDDPTAFGKKKAGYHRSLFGIRGKACELLYTVKENDVAICSLERESNLSDVGMSDREIHDTLELYGIIWETNTDNDKLVRELQAQIESTKARLVSIKEAYTEARNKVDSVELELKTIETEKKALAKELEKYKRALQTVLTKPDLNSEQKDKLIKQLAVRIKELENAVKDKDLQYKEVIAECEELKKKFDEQKRQLETEIKHHQQLIEKLKHAIKESETEIASLNEAIENSENQNRFLQRALDSEKLKSQKNSDAYIKLDQANKKQREQIKENNKKIKGQKERINGYLEKIQELEELDAKSKADIKKYEDSLNKVKIENDELRTKQFRQESYENKDIRNQFLEAITKAKKEIDIISPWVGSMAESEAFLSRMQEAVKKEVIVKVIYGIGNTSGKSRNDAVSRDALRTLIASRADRTDSSEMRSVRDIYYLHRRFDRIRRGSFKSLRSDTHAKLLIVDNEFFMIGSFNFLSFEGNYRYQDYDKRTEIAIKSTDKNMIDVFRSKYFSFNENKPEWITDNLGEPNIVIKK